MRIPYATTAHTLYTKDVLHLICLGGLDGGESVSEITTFQRTITIAILTDSNSSRKGDFIMKKLCCIYFIFFCIDLQHSITEKETDSNLRRYSFIFKRKVVSYYTV